MVRLSFSISLLEHIKIKIQVGKIIKAKLVIGEELSEGDISRSGLYAICKSKTKWPLRVTLFQKLADLWRHDTRKIYEAWLKF